MENENTNPIEPTNPSDPRLIHPESSPQNNDSEIFSIPPAQSGNDLIEAKPTDPLVKRIPKAKIKFPKDMKLRTYDDSVARHIARIYVNKAGGDMADTLRWMKPGFKDEEYFAYAKVVLQQEKVRVAIDKEYIEIGIDEEAKKKYIGELWRAIREGTEKTKQVALGLMGRAMGVGEMADDTRTPVELPIKGVDKGWQRMTGKEAVAAQNPTGFSKLNDEMPPED